ncbi:MAG: class I SAM-dependent methyltransferase [Acidimicrobiales bacterium]
MTGHWFEDVADHLGTAYLRYSFTKGTRHEVDALIDLLDLVPGERILDVGCGPGRHSLALAERGFDVVGIDIAERFVEIANTNAPDNATFLVCDARDLAFDQEFDAVISLCQGAFGLAGGAGAHDVLPARELDEPILNGMFRALKRGGRLGVSAFSAYFQLRYLEAHDTFDALTGVNHERTSIKSEAGVDQETDLWTTTFTPRELRLLARVVGLEVDDVFSVTPGDYARNAPTIDAPEFLLIAHRPGIKTAP